LTKDGTTGVLLSDGDGCTPIVAERSMGLSNKDMIAALVENTANTPIIANFVMSTSEYTSLGLAIK
jgi:hypothetical protein